MSESKKVIYKFCRHEFETGTPPWAKRAWFDCCCSKKCCLAELRPLFAAKKQALVEVMQYFTKCLGALVHAEELWGLFDEAADEEMTDEDTSDEETDEEADEEVEEESDEESDEETADEEVAHEESAGNYLRLQANLNDAAWNLAKAVNKHSGCAPKHQRIADGVFD